MYVLPDDLCRFVRNRSDQSSEQAFLDWLETELLMEEAQEFLGGLTLDDIEQARHLWDQYAESPGRGSGATASTAPKARREAVHIMLQTRMTPGQIAAWLGTDEITVALQVSNIRRTAECWIRLAEIVEERDVLPSGKELTRMLGMTNSCTVNGWLRQRPHWSAKRPAGKVTARLRQFFDQGMPPREAMAALEVEGMSMSRSNITVQYARWRRAASE